ncbi:hypothetical protein BBOV_II004770 [Babesia bovis T2Bo]|uniref:5'-3' DNA helicase ZGRF1-like N-terminal domain-containing protein n=1 Tax=Babesia bovis TaxID=5865 RepID=A7AU21_BABBO|nr:hypothetical protein BBOV_II004770 [Babesia bovis T2Bo]EDO06432.1 hypothetical protein BBOV_II004770 [Babesia bovis T2Bo]|eukprot:XP_001610000.1 hypothetical protein [Babesia bovis T2Bo]
MVEQEYDCLYAKNNDRKHKTWRDGVLSVQGTHKLSKVSLYEVDSPNMLIGSPIDVFELFNIDCSCLTGHTITSPKYIIKVIEVNNTVRKGELRCPVSGGAGSNVPLLTTCTHTSGRSVSQHDHKISDVPHHMTYTPGEPDGAVSQGLRKSFTLPSIGNDPLQSNFERKPLAFNEERKSLGIRLKRHTEHQPWSTGMGPGIDLKSTKPVLPLGLSRAGLYSIRRRVSPNAAEPPVEEAVLPTQKDTSRAESPDVTQFNELSPTQEPIDNQALIETADQPSQISVNPSTLDNTLVNFLNSQQEREKPTLNEDVPLVDSNILDCIASALQHFGE